MLRRALLPSIYLAVLLFIGCGGTTSETADNSNTDVSVVPEYSDAQTALAEGTKFLDQDEVEKAIAALNQAVKLDPGLADAYFNLGVAYALVEMRDQMNLENQPIPGDTDPKKKSNSQIAFEKAADAFKKVVDEHPENHQAYFSLGLAYNKLNRDEQAAKAFRQAVKLNPEDAQYQIELGKILIKLAQYREAIAPLKKALELDPENVDAEELLSDAEAGRSRIDYVSAKKDTDSSSSSNTRSEPQSDTSNSNTSRPDTKPTEKPSPRATQSSPEPRQLRTPAAANRPR
ncbi:tetratricopeptide repeat protein [Leptolyngbya sp. 7M]|uniref:tetratricopeptide repeat protein n=1 Tax=Leptolyngbya sp. 7M TaxID=2812896 RepID=UPI001B8C8C8A|nr:tetratricopeptide repeat protein [Leptolyngbya sp. 7M]QYO66778.1 tetratricopeptide repeat protein [Leptolyngbya sp. 7M]